ncbi:hypothetical protein [Orrella dioscoreae]|uniref:Uncharacterized protein n=2 Tax=root TaxID=1 RepID=A0A1C3JXV9_9BURK|nr:hypothetical protein [Orrella dioscoreae]SBT23997.1 hypothetical protein ODI_03416 [Orrella dioscoreae]SOE51685.1 hypothetical protein ODI_R3618 [Orrella dioscoreae]
MSRSQSSVAVGHLPYWLALAGVGVLWLLQVWQAQRPPEMLDPALQGLMPDDFLAVSVHYVPGGADALLAAGLVTFLVAQAVLQRPQRAGVTLAWQGWAAFAVIQGILQFTPAWVVGWAAGPWLLDGNLFLMRAADLLMQAVVSWVALRLALRVPGATRAGQPHAGATGGRAAVVFGAFSLTYLLSLWLVVMAHFSARWAYLDPAEATRQVLLVVGYLVLLGVVGGLGAWWGLRAEAPVRMRRLLLLSLLGLLLAFAAKLVVTISARGMLTYEQLIGPWSEGLLALVALLLQFVVAAALTRRWG